MQEKIETQDLKENAIVRVVFKRADRSWRYVFWKVKYVDNRSAILNPIYGESYLDKPKIFDFDDVDFYGADALYRAVTQ